MSWNKREAFKKGLSGFQMKLMALLFMTVDHIGLYFAAAGAPVWFRWIGRLSAPLFLFLLVEGFMHTRSRKRYLCRLYVAGSVMALVNLLLNTLLSRPDGIRMQSNIFFSLFWVFLLLTGWETMCSFWRQGKKGAAWMVVGGVAAWFAAARLMRVLPVPQELFTAAELFLPDLFTVEGGVWFVLKGILWYAFRAFPAARGAIYAAMCLCQFPSVSSGLDAFFLTGYSWMEVFVLLLWPLYNGTRGRSAKLLFYTYYPIHMALLFALSCALPFEGTG